MGHKTLIDGVGYDITGGRCLVDGVGYSIQKGRTLDDGVGYDVAFGGVSATVTIKGHGNSSYYYAGEATINGTRYIGRSSPLTLDVEIGTEIVCKALTPSQIGFDVYDSAEIMLNGKTVKSGYSGNVTYTYVVVGNTEISLGIVGDAGQVRIVEL